MRRQADRASKTNTLEVTSRRVKRSRVFGRRFPLVAAFVLVAVGLLLPTAVQASTPITSFSTATSSTQAGGHPDVGFHFTLENRSSTSAGIDPCDCKMDPRNITVHLPTGLIANPHATPQCSVAYFASEICPVDSQVGIVEFDLNDAFGSCDGCVSSHIAPVFNLVPPPGETALLGYKSAVIDTPTFTVVSARTGSDYGIDATVSNIDHFIPLLSVKEVLWGVPASPIHDYLRFELGETTRLALSPTENLCDANGTTNGDQATEELSTVFQLCKSVEGSGGPAAGHGKLGATPHPEPSNSPEEPFWQNPTTCGVSSLDTSLDILSYDDGTSHADSVYPATTGCEQLTFNPSQSISPTTTAADSPSGAEFSLSVPQFENPSVPSPSELRAAHITLPEGFSLAPNVTNGKTTCSDAQAKFGTTEEAECPEDSKIGTLTINTPVLPGPLPGAAYLGESLPGSRFRLFLVGNGFGVHLKLAGTVTPNPTTGQIVIAFEELPQSPIESFNLHMFGSERGPLATPTQCGTYEVSNLWTPWDSALPDQVSRQFFTIDEGPNGSPCPNGPRPFHPDFQAAAASNTAAAHTTFSIDLTRNDGEQNLSALNVSTPPGFSATLKGVTYCPQAAIVAAEAESHSGLSELASPSCQSSSQVGETTAGAGAGDHPLFLTGKVYLAGPYRGAPLSLVIITPAVSGGYDLGNVVVRAALRVNPETAQVTAVSDPLPQIFQGIPLRLRQILVNLNRPNFALNPTDCNPLEVKAEVFGTEGALSSPSEHFQVANCATLPFAPQLNLKLSGSTKQAGNPALTATLTAKPGEANISRTQVTLPRTELIDNAHINNLCTRVQFNEGKTPGEKCPPGSILGFAKADTPLLEKPLEGPIYLRATGRAGLPDVVAALNGQIDIVLDGHVDSVHGRLRTTFETVPDAPVTKFTLHLDGGKKGLLENSPELCAHAQHVAAAIIGQNGKSANQTLVLETPCVKKHHKRARISQVNRANRGGAANAG